MRATYSPEAEAFREKVQAFLAEHLPAGWQGIGALDHDACVRFTSEWRTHAARARAARARLARRSTAAAGSPPLEQVDRGRGVHQGGRAAGWRRTTCSASRWSATRSCSGAPRSRSATTCRASCRARTSGARATPSPTPGPTSATSACRAVLDGDEWVINGQKIWTSAGHLANWIFVLARTDPDAPKHKGISFLLVPMDQPGVEVRPIKMITGDSRVQRGRSSPTRVTPKDERRRRGERRLGRRHDAARLRARRGRGDVPDPVPHRARPAASHWPRSAGVADDPVIRQRWRGATRKVEIMRYLGMRTLTQFLRRPAPRARRLDLQAVLERVPPKVVTELAVDILGADAMVPSGRRPANTFQTDDAGRPELVELVGRRRSSTRGPAPSTPARARSSATSSARWSSACRRSRRPLTRRGLQPARRARHLGCGFARRPARRSGPTLLADGGPPGRHPAGARLAALPPRDAVRHGRPGPGRR